jgi:tetratricopeptide (TPR) repeat protein
MEEGPMSWNNAIRHFVMPFAAALMFVLAGCTTQKDTGKVPITTSSEEAKKEFLLGRDLVERTLVQKSIGHFESAIAKDANFAMAYLRLAQTSQTAKPFLENLKKAVALADKASNGERLMILAFEAGVNGNPVKQKKFYDSLVAAYPKDERAHLALGDYYNGQQEYAKAAEQYKKATELDSVFSPAYNSLGYAYRAMDQNADAEKAFKKYIELIPNDPNPFDSYAELLMKMGRFDESIAQYEKALALEPDFVTSHIGIAANLLFKGKPDEADARLQKLYDIAHSDGERLGALFAKTIHYVDGGKMDKAVQEMDKQFALAEKINDAWVMSSDLSTKGAILLQAGKYDEASAAFEKSKQIVEGSDLPQAIKDQNKLGRHYSAAMLAMKRKDLGTATAESEEYRKGTEAIRDQAAIRVAHSLAGELALEAKQYDKALAELEQADQLNPRNLYRMSLAYLGKGDKAKAKEFCTKAAHSYVIPTLDYAFIRVKAEKMLSTM